MTSAGQADDQSMSEEPSPRVAPSFDFKTDVPPGTDPDSHSSTLRAYHQLLWSKVTPSGVVLDLQAPAARSDGYLIHACSDGRREWFGSDTITTSYGAWTLPKELVAAREALDDVQRARYLQRPYTIASAMIWPVRSKQRPTINQARGTRSAIDDRIDLTLECIRRHYAGQQASPLADVLSAYEDFFALFSTFEGFVDFFHLQDLVSPSYDSVEFFLPFGGFERRGAPATVSEYVTYREGALAFIEARGHRIDAWASANTGRT